MKRGTLSERIETRLEKADKRRLVALAKREDRSEGAIVRRAIRAYLDLNEALSEERDRLVAGR